MPIIVTSEDSASRVTSITHWPVLASGVVIVLANCLLDTARASVNARTHLDKLPNPEPYPKGCRYLFSNPPTLGGVLDGFSNGEGENPILFSLQPETRGAGGGGGRGGGVGGVSRARFPPGPHLRSSRFSRLLGLLHQVNIYSPKKNTSNVSTSLFSLVGRAPAQ